MHMQHSVRCTESVISEVKQANEHSAWTTACIGGMEVLTAAFPAIFISRPQQWPFNISRVVRHASDTVEVICAQERTARQWH